MTAVHSFDAVIAALEAQRVSLGDAEVEAAIRVLRAAGAATASAAPQRLRQVSVLFIDVVDSTRLLRAVEVQAAAEVLDTALQGFAAVVRGHGGEVLRFTGDGLKAAFGTQGTSEDTAERAVRAGLALLDAAAAHGQMLRRQHRIERFEVRVGIHTGPVVLGGGAEADRTAIGEAVHLAARIEQAAPAGRLLISQDTQAQVRGLFRLEARPPLFVKGLDEPLTTWIVDAAIADAERAVQRGIEGLETPLVGREGPLQALLDAHAEARAGRCVRAVTILADAGVGKTRLRREWLARLAPRADALLQARSHPDGTLQAYGLLRQLVMRWLGIADDLDAAAARARLLDGLLPWLGSRAETRAGALGQLLGLDFGDSVLVRALSPRELRSTAFDALHEALHAMARHQAQQDGALVVVLDDLHWADAGSLDFIEQLARPADLPLLLVLLARPALRERRPGPWLAAARPQPLTIELAPLDGQHAPALARALLAPLPDAPPELLRLLLERAEGNPFYMEELLRMWIDEGVIDAHSRPWRLVRHWQQSARVPATLAGVLQARLDALPADELLALQQASIVGTVFWDSALAAVDAAAPAALPALGARQLVLARDGSAFEQTAERSFHHQLLHDATYDTVLAAARRAGHARVARWLSERLADRAGEFLGITAEHFERAGDSAQALEYYDRARSAASRRYAHEATLEYAERALRQPALTDPMWRYVLLTSRHNALDSSGRVEAANRVRHEMEALAEREDSDAMRADNMVTRMLRADAEGHVDEAQRLAREAVILAERSGAASPAALAHGELAWLAVMRREHDLAATHIDLGIAQARRAARMHVRAGGYPDYEHQLRAIQIESLLIRERYFDASAAARAALEVLTEHKLHDRVNMLLRLARALAEVGELDAAEAAAREAMATAEATGKPVLHATAGNVLARVLGLRGLHDERERVAAAAEAAGRANMNAAVLAQALVQRAEVAFERGQVGPARALWSEAASALAELGARADELEARAGLCLLDSASDAPAHTLLGLLADAAGADADWRHASSTLLLRAMRVLEAAGHDRAPAVREVLVRRLAEQMAQAPDTAARARLVSALPHWGAVAPSPAQGEA